MNAQRYAQLMQTLEKILATLTGNYQPEKVILLISLAAGDISEWSDSKQ